ncbi:uncharacterized protein TA03835 [Theileria annulata]|uniref:Uncharacterized protein n=1 Tax=Theileria annulata TaxID=5874 RepID=Q4UCD6_THEAN|nr:uncharacterized protein TA03835 [Theileria annulata]CAI75515.1 hypothetical protein, conserved [Theileria annulata]|eukprot:XP_954991.1 hypothetical protein, conserved [Theileria annulata]
MSGDQKYKEEEEGPLQIVAYMFAGLAMMLNIRLSYSAAPFALLRFKLPENLFSVFVRTTSSSLELWCLFTMLLVNIIDTGSKLLFKHGVIKPPAGTADGVPNDTDNNKSKSLKLLTIIYPSIVTMWTYSYEILKHGEHNDRILRFGTSQAWDAYDTIRNTSVTFNANLNAGSGGTGFESNGSITITVTKGGDKFTELGNASPNVEIKLSTAGSSIKKCDKDGGQPQDFTNGTVSTLDKDTKLYIQATGSISKPSGAGEVTIKAILTVTSSGQSLGNTGLSLRGDPSKDPSSDGLTGTITPTGNSKVTIQDGGNIDLTNDALKALKLLTKNAVTLTKDSFASKATIKVTGYDFKSLTVPTSQNLQIYISGGTIKMYNEKGQLEELKTNTGLKAGTKLSLNATGQITEPPANNAHVNLAGTIVVTNKEQQQMGSSLTFNVGPNRSGVTGTLTLKDETGPPKHVKITSSNLTISKEAYTTIQMASDTTSSSFTIGSVTNIKYPNTNPNTTIPNITTVILETVTKENTPTNRTP